MLIQLRNGGSSLIFRATDETLEIAHWGAELGELTENSMQSTKRSIAHGDLDVNPRNLILREHSRGWRGRPALRGHRYGKSVSNYCFISSLLLNCLQAAFDFTFVF